MRPPGFVAADPATPVSGVNDAAGAPFWFNGQPSLAANPLAVAPTPGATYDGRRLRNSGLPTGSSPRPYRLRFTRTGSFDYYCTIHPGMVGTVRVVSRRRTVPTEAQNRAAATRELARLAVQARTAAREDSSAPATVTRDALRAGSASRSTRSSRRRCR